MYKIQPISRVYEADKFEILRAILDSIQKREGLSQLKKRFLIFLLLYPRKNRLKRKSKVCPFDTQIK